jgi:hypothetical protein
LSADHPSPTDLDAFRDRLDAAARPLVTHESETTRNGSGHAAPDSQGKGPEVPAEPQASAPVPRLGAEAAANMTKLSSEAARDIRQLGQLAFDAGKRVQEECEQMARDVEAHGGTVALHLTGLSQLLAEVGVSNRDTLRRLVGGLPPAIVGPADDDQAPERAGGIDNAAPLGRRGVRVPTWLRS